MDPGGQPDGVTQGKRERTVRWGRALMALITVGTILISSLLIAVAIVGAVGPLLGANDAISQGNLALVIVQVLVCAGVVSVASLRGSLSEAMLWRGPAAGTYAAIAWIAAVMVVVLGGYTVAVFVWAPEIIKKDLSVFLPMIQSPTWWLAILAVAIGAPVSEELLFRGWFLRELLASNVGFVPAALLANLMWTALHYQYSPVGLFEVFLAGLLLSWAVWRTGSVVVSIGLHAAYNCVALAVMFAVAT